MPTGVLGTFWHKIRVICGPNGQAVTTLQLAQDLA